MNPHPALDPEAYDQLCRKTPDRARLRSSAVLAGAHRSCSRRRAGFHRFAWDLRMDPIGSGGGGGGGGGAGGAVPHHTYPGVAAPWAPPGAYTVRLTVDGKQYTQPITLRLDPRVKTPAGRARAARVAHARDVRRRRGGARRRTIRRARCRRSSRAPAATTRPRSSARSIHSRRRRRPVGAAGADGGGGGGGGRGRGGAPEVQNLETVMTSQMAAAMAMQAAEVAPTASQVAAVTKARGDAAAVMKRWTTLKTSGLAALERKTEESRTECDRTPMTG